MSKYNINEMNLYKSTNRFMKSYFALKKELKRAPTINELSSIDHLHYNGIKAVDNAIKEAKIKKDSIVLDIGSGIGGPARYIAYKTKALVYAVEIQNDLHKIGQMLTNDYNLNKSVKHIKEDINKFSVEKIKFNIVVSWLALYHIADHKKLLEKINVIMKKNGYFYTEDFFLVNDLDSNEKEILSKSFHANHLVGYEEYLQELCNKSFKVISHKDMTENWLKFTKTRLDSYKDNFEKNITLFGLSTAENVLTFYELAYSLLFRKKIGGIRFLCQKI